MHTILLDTAGINQYPILDTGIIRTLVIGAIRKATLPKLLPYNKCLVVHLHLCVILLHAHNLHRALHPFCSFGVRGCRNYRKFTMFVHRWHLSLNLWFYEKKNEFWWKLLPSWMISWIDLKYCTLHCFILIAFCLQCDQSLWCLLADHELLYSWYLSVNMFHFNSFAFCLFAFHFRKAYQLPFPT